jgi:hypothetical protein
MLSGSADKAVQDFARLLLLIVMPGPRVTVRGTVSGLEPEDDPGIHVSGGQDRCVFRAWIAGSSPAMTFEAGRIGIVTR